jgi:hypothetical protein
MHRYRACLDIETLSTLPTAAVIGIGLAVRDYETQVTLSKSWFINRSLIIGHEDLDTIGWWSLQDEKETVWGGMLFPREACDQLIAWWKDLNLPDDTPIYADPAHFDFPRLQQLFVECDRTLPWIWKQEHCSDSIVHFLRELGAEIPSAASKRPHHPEFDAIASLDQLDACFAHCTTLTIYE